MSKLKIQESVVNHIMTIKETNNIPLLEAIIEYCEQANVDYEDLNNIIKKDKTFIEMIKAEAIEANQLRKTDGWYKINSLNDYF